MVRLGGGLALWVAAVAGPALAQGQAGASSTAIEAAYVADVIGPVQGGASQRGVFLDNFNLVIESDLGFAGWGDVAIHADLLYNGGGAPNEFAGTLQGIDNIEVSSHRLRLFEAWLEKPLGAHSLRLGLYDLNSEFYSNDSAGLLMAPAFGIGSEIAATGPNGPSIFPSTALAARFDAKISDSVYARAAILNANAGVLGDPDGVDVDFDHGALLIAEAGVHHSQKIAFGAWRYTDRQDDIRDVESNGDPRRRVAQGAYVLVEAPLSGGEEGRAVTGFFRAGVSDGATTAFEGGWQAGILVDRAIPGRPDSQLSFGVNQGLVSDGHRRNEIDVGMNLGENETQFEITYADRLGEHVTIQPDLQYIPNPAADRDADSVFVAGLRIGIEL